MKCRRVFTLISAFVCFLLFSCLLKSVQKYEITNSDALKLYTYKYENVHNNRRARIELITAFSEELQPNEKSRRCAVEKVNEIDWDNEQYQEIRYDNIYLFSAYYDNRYNFRGKSYHFVRVLSIVRDAIDTELTCYLWPEDSSTPLTVAVHKLELWKAMWGKGSSVPLYKTYLLSCVVPTDFHYRISGVSISNERCKTPKTYMRIEKPNLTASKADFVVCVKAIDYEEDISRRLIEWVELQRILGANKISIYVYQLHPNVDKVLHYYESLGIVERYNLSLPGQLPNFPKERFQYLKDNRSQKRRLELLPYNDCFYRHLYTHRFAVLLDIDEAIVPVVNRTWIEMLNFTFTHKPEALHTYPSFSVSNVYFFNTFPETTANDAIPSSMHMLNHVRRSSNFSRMGFAVKSFISTNYTLAVFNHYYLFSLYSYMTKYGMISRSLAQLSHYRNKCPNTMRKECDDNFLKFTEIDTLIWKYKTELIARFKTVLKTIGLGII